MQKELKKIIKNYAEEILWQLQHYRIRVADKPTEIHLSVTEDCCLQCKMCDIWRIKKKQKPLDYNTGKKIINKLSNWLGSFYLTFAGGEPFLNKDVPKIIKYASNRDIKTSINTNGFIINKQLAEKICKSGLSSIFFSIDGDEKEHDFIRGKKGSFYNALKAISYMQRTKSKRKPKVFINTVISNNNLVNIGEMVEFARKIKVEGIKFQVLMPNFAGIYKNDWWEKNPFWPRDKKVVKGMINKLRIDKEKFDNFILNSKRDLKFFRKYLQRPDRFQKKEKCFVGLNNLMIDTSGNVRLCYEMDKIGNLINGNPDSIWRGSRADIGRKKIANCQKPCKLLPCNVVNYKDFFKEDLKNIKKFFVK